MSNHHHDRMHHLLDIMLQAQEALAEAKRRHEPAYQAAREAQYEIGNLESAADIAVEKLYRAMLGRPEKMEPPKHEPEEKKAE